MPVDPTRALVSRLRYLLNRDNRRLVLLLGAGATMPLVPGVVDLTAQAQRFADEWSGFRDSSAQSPPAGQMETPSAGLQGQRISEYAAALQLVQQVRGTEGIRAFIQRAVLHAYTGRAPSMNDGRPLSDRVMASLERDQESWRLPDGLQALAEIIRRRDGLFAPHLLTTNFDPLLEVAMRKAGLRVETVAVGRDYSIEDLALGQGERVVLHLHGFCHGDELHSPWAVGRTSPAYEAWLPSLLEGATLLVVGYSGWDVTIGRALRKQLTQPGVGGVGSRLEVLWALYEDQETHRYVNPQLSRFFADYPTVITPYHGVDRDRLFGDLVDALSVDADTGGFRTLSGGPTDTNEVARRLYADFRFGISRLRVATPRLVFWPHRLRRPNLNHGVHALAAIMLSRTEIEIELHLDDTDIGKAYADQLAQEFTDAVTAWFKACGAERMPTILRTSDLLERGGSGEATLARLWTLSRDFFSPRVSAFDALVAAKILKPHEEHFKSPTAAAHRVLQPVYIWLALEDAIQRHGLSTSGPAQVITLSDEDDQSMWDLWRRRDAPGLASIYVPKFDVPSSDVSLWDRRELQRDNPYAEHDLETFALNQADGGPGGERLLEWIFTSAVQLPVAASNGLIEGLTYDGTTIDSWPSAMDALRRDPVGAARAIARAVSRWFHAE